MAKNNSLVGNLIFVDSHIVYIRLKSLPLTTYVLRVYSSTLQQTDNADFSSPCLIFAIEV